MTAPHAPEDVDEPRLMTRAQVAALFQREPRTISEWARKGLLRPIRIGQAIYFQREDIERILEG